MVLAADWQVGEVLWTFIWFTFLFIWIWLAISVFIDIFRSHDMNGWVKALWILFIIVAPFLGVFIYVIVNGRAMGERDLAAAQQRDAEFQTYVRETAGTSGAADELTKLAALRDSGALTDAEFAAQKAKLLTA